MNRNMDEHSAKLRATERKLEDFLPIVGAATELVQAIEFASPFEIREAARQLDDIGNNPATSAKLRPLYRAMSDVVKSWR